MRGPAGQAAVGGDGPVPSRVMFVGEAPAREELKQGRPFVGLSGQVLWQYAELHAGLLRDDVYTTNVVKHPVDPEIGPTPDEIEYWRPMLEEELRRVQPKYVVALGRHSANWFLPGIGPLDEVHGLPHRANLHPDFNPVVIPVFHPAAGLYDPRKLHQTALGLEAAGQIIRGGGPTLPRDEHPDPHYFWGLPTGPAAYCAIDTEGWRDEPWTLQWSTTPGEGGIILASDIVSIEQFKAWLRLVRPTILMHSALHDLAVLRAMGVDIVGMGLPVLDTLVFVYNDQRLPGGLKPLARRLCGMEMQDWRSVVGVHDERVCYDYLARVVGLGDRWPAGVGRKHGITRLAKARLTPSKSAEKKSIRERWLEIDPELRAPVEAELGPMPRVRLTDVPHADFTRYAGRDPDATLRVFYKLKERMVDGDLIAISKLDNSVIPITDRMQEVGMPVDLEKTRAFGAELDERIAGLDELIGVVTDGAVDNPGSGDKIAKWCESAGIKLDKMTESGKRPSTDDEALQRVKEQHPVFPLILDRRELSKLRDSYVHVLLDEVGEDARYHPDFRLTKDAGTGKVNRAVSGRLTEWILTIPVRSEQGKRVRQLFVAPPGYKFGSADLSQLELRLIADASGDPKMIEAFTVSQVDIHVQTASWMFGVPVDKVDKRLHRAPAKSINYLMGYGGDENTLHEKLVTEARITTYDLLACKGLLVRWYDLFANVGPWKQDVVDQARRTGYARTRWGRRRYLTAAQLHPSGVDRWIDRKLEELRREAERQIVNHEIQGTATELIERAENRLWFKGLPELHKLGIDVQPVLQYHDEIVVLFKDERGAEDEVKRVVLGAMTADSPHFKVPIASDWSSAQTWGDLK